MSELITTVGHTTPFDVEDTPPGSTAPAALLIASPSQRDGFLDGTLAAGVLAPPDVYPAAPPVEVPYIEVPRTKRRRGGRYGWHKLQTLLPLVDRQPVAAEQPPSAYTPVSHHRRNGWFALQTLPDVPDHPASPPPPTLASYPSNVRLDAIRRTGWIKFQSAPELFSYPVTPKPESIVATQRVDVFSRRTGAESRRPGWNTALRPPELNRYQSSGLLNESTVHLTAIRRNGWRKHLQVAELNIRPLAASVAPECAYRAKTVIRRHGIHKIPQILAFLPPTPGIPIPFTSTAEDIVIRSFLIEHRRKMM